MSHAPARPPPRAAWWEVARGSVVARIRLGTTRPDVPSRSVAELETRQVEAGSDGVGRMPTDHVAHAARVGDLERAESGLVECAGAAGRVERDQGHPSEPADHCSQWISSRGPASLGDGMYPV